MRFVSIIYFAVLLSISRAQAQLTPLTISSDDTLPAARWMFGSGEVPKGETGWALLAAAKKALMVGDYDVCLKKAESAWAKTKAVHPWVTILELECAMRLKPSAARSDSLHRVLLKVEKNPLWLITGAHADALQTASVRGYLTALEQDVKTNRERALKTIERVEELELFTEGPTRARLWRLAGELAFQTQNMQASRELMRKSLREADDEETRSRLTAIDSAIGSDGEGARAAGKTVPNPLLEASKEELELVDRVTNDLKSGELVSAVNDAISLIRAYPGGNRAKWAYDRVLDAYWSIAEKSDAKFILARGQMVKQMESADADRTSEWAKAMFARGQWEDSLALARAALDSITGARATPIIELAAKAAIATDRFDVARRFLDRLLTQHAGTPAAREALFRSGLLHFRLKAFGQAVSDFERLLALPQIEKFEISARYWLWRSLQRTQSAVPSPTQAAAAVSRADSVADELLRRFPFSYYGLRVRMERNANVLEWKPEKGKFSAKFWLTSGERKAWDRALLLMRAGWIDEAQEELKEMPAPQKSDEKAMRAIVWAAAGHFQHATRLANEAWDENPELRREPLVSAAFPKVFTETIDAQANTRKLDRYLVRGLIKQESSFNSRAVSSANAMGLMQLMAPTAKEIAQELKLGALSVPDDLYQPARNIQMGSYYFAKLVNRANGHVPLALASYNAGPTRIDRWLRHRPSLKNLSQTRSSLPEDEIWFDELPYSETSAYVKSILRNTLIYKMLDQGRVQVSDPIWAQDIQAQD